MEQVGFLIIGGGIAGLSAAIRLAAIDTVLVVNKEELTESNTAYAQGGIAVATGGAEDVAEHLEDTVNAGDGLVNRQAAAVFVEHGPKRVEELLSWGTDFDREPETNGGDLLRTRERRTQPLPHPACAWRRYRPRDRPLAPSPRPR